MLITRAGRLAKEFLYVLGASGRKAVIAIYDNVTKLTSIGLYRSHRFIGSPEYGADYLKDYDDRFQLGMIRISSYEKVIRYENTK